LAFGESQVLGETNALHWAWENIRPTVSIETRRQNATIDTEMVQGHEWYSAFQVAPKIAIAQNI